MIEFIQRQKPNTKIPTFFDVQEDQFFIDLSGNLCQKSGDDNYVTIANSYSIPFSTIEKNVKYDEEITSTLAFIENIKFQ